jgi:hypothetical protein
VDLQRLRAIHDYLLRGGFCATWLAALVISFYEFLDMHMTYCLLSMLVFVVAILCHAYLVHAKHD